MTRMDNEPVPDFLIRWARTAAQPRAGTPWSLSVPVIALGIVAILTIAGAGDYWLYNAEQKQVVEEVAIPTALLAPETARSVPQLTKGLPAPDDRPPLDVVTKPPLAASLPVAASEQPPTTAFGFRSTTEQVPLTAPASQPPQVPTEKLADALSVFVVRFDSKLPDLTPSGIRALEAALRAAHAGHRVQIAIEGCTSGDNMASHVDCAKLVRRLKGILADSGVHQPAALIANSQHP
jgi:hypothetical protein